MIWTLDERMSLKQFRSIAMAGMMNGVSDSTLFSFARTNRAQIYFYTNDGYKKTWTNFYTKCILVVPNNGMCEKKVYESTAKVYKL